MKKLVVDCQNKVEQVLNKSSTKLFQNCKQGLSILQEGLITCISKTPSRQGFPFDLPDADYVSKLILSEPFLNELISKFNNENFDNTILLLVQEIKFNLNEFLSSGILDNLREIKVLNTNFIKLRKIFDDDEASSQQIKDKIHLFYRQLKKHQIKHPKLKIIPKRLKKYWNNLFYCYDDKRIPRTNNDIERLFNALKRIKRRRTGRRNSPTFFTHEGKALLHIENITSNFKRDLTETRFIN